MQVKKIITHTGNFHADEITACALLKILYPEVEIVRTYNFNIQEIEAEEGTILVDQGRIHNGIKFFDHPQDADLPASNILILKAFAPKIKESFGEGVAEEIPELLFGYISRVDTGQTKEFSNQMHTLPGIIRAFNNTEGGWDTAFPIVVEILRAIIKTAQVRIETRPRWAEFEKAGRYAISPDEKYPVGWQELAIEEGRYFIIRPNTRGGWQIESADSVLFPIPPDPRQTFLHNSRFTASYQTKEEAVAHANEFAVVD
jgi:uncharacterized UPF0160 family protein